MAPAGEFTLRLLEWVQAAERNKQNARSGAINTAPDLAQKASQSKYEKTSKSGPKKS